jgi:fermentation-respiration switch protein FrsA (DUF1100 family)
MNILPVLKRFRWLLIFLFLFIASSFFLSASCKNRLMYYPDKGIITEPGAAGLPFEDVYFRTADRVKLHGWWVPSPKARATVLFCHGNAGNISYRIDSITVFNRLRLNVFIFDYRGYGLSEGKPFEEGTYSDVQAAWQYLVKMRSIDPGGIILFGRSLGGPIAACQAANSRPGMLILESTFTAARDVAKHHYPMIPSQYIFGSTYPTIEFIKKVRCPVLVIHSPGDEVIPYEMGVRLHEAAPSPKNFMTIQGSHNSGFFESLGYYEPGLEKFISRFFK